MIDIRPYLEQVCDRFADPKVQESLKTFNKTLRFDFSDTRQTFVIVVVEGQPTLEERAAENADVTVSTTSDVLAGIMDHKINAINAYMTRKVKVQGAQQDLMKLQKLLF